MAEPQIDGWHYSAAPPADGDSRKLVTLERGGMTWVGIRAFNYAIQRWMNNNELETATVKAWRDLPAPADGHFHRGILYVRKDAASPWITPYKDPPPDLDALIRDGFERRRATSEPGSK